MILVFSLLFSLVFPSTSPLRLTVNLCFHSLSVTDSHGPMLEMLPHLKTTFFGGWSLVVITLVISYDFPTSLFVIIQKDTFTLFIIHIYI